jgi:AcrR family transcriptional regulator
VARTANSAAHASRARTAGWRDCTPLELSAIQQAALSAFREHGYHGAAVRDVAARANVTVPALYYHHGSKQGMLVDLFDIAMRDLLVRLQMAVAEAGESPLARFRNIIEAIALHMTYRQELAALDSELGYLEPENREHYAELRAEVQRLLRTTIEDGVQSGQLHVAHPGETTRALLGMLLAITTWYRPDGPLSPQELAARYAEIAMQTVGASPTRTSEPTHSRSRRPVPKSYDQRL